MKYSRNILILILFRECITSPMTVIHTAHTHAMKDIVILLTFSKRQECNQIAIGFLQEDPY